MRIEIVSIGSEIVKGQILNTNAPFIAQHLVEKGFDVSFHSSVRDQKGEIKRHLMRVFERADLAILTGGLGPTHDDITREEICQFLGKSLIPSEAVRQTLTKRYGEDLLSLENQALVPEGAYLFPNHAGTAPGFFVERENKALVAMPGVPLEMEQMFVNQVVPYLEKVYPQREKYFSEKINFCSLCESDVVPSLELLQKEFPQVEMGIYPDYGNLSIVLESTYDLFAVKKKLVDTFFSHHLENDATLNAAIYHWMKEHRKTLVLTESCTGGNLAQELIKCKGTSQYLLGSLVLYKQEMKEKFLSIPPEFFQKEHVVSAQSAKAMAESALAQTGADFALSTTGDLEPPGIVYAALACKGGKTGVQKITLKSVRNVNLLFATNKILGAFYRHIQHKIPFA